MNQDYSPVYRSCIAVSDHVQFMHLELTEFVNKSILKLHIHWIEGETISDISGQLMTMSGKR